MSDMKKYFFLFFLLLSFSGFAQQTINNYKYVIVPETFSFLKEKDKYELNTLTKKLIEDKGFTAYFDSAELPAEISGNKCVTLHLEILAKSNMFSTGLTILLKDCNGNTIFKSKEGKSREKEYDVSYTMALRDAFTSFDTIHYAYQAPANVLDAPIVKKTELSTPLSQASAKVLVTESGQNSGTLYAQQTENGYQLIDTAPKIILTLYKTSAADYFIANNASSNGIVLKRDGNWYFEYYKDGKLLAEKLLIKF